MSQSENKNAGIEKVSFETAMDATGFGLYSYFITALTGLLTICCSLLLFGNTIIVPTSACELGTTSAQQGLLVAAPIIGNVLGSPVWGFLGDSYGRRKMLLVSLLCSPTIAAISSISVHWAMLLILQFTAVLFGSGQYSLAMTLLSESTPMAKRNVVVLLVSSIFMLAVAVSSFLAIPVIPLAFSIYLPALDIYWNSWRTLILVYCLPSFFAAICLFFMKESPKYMLVKGDKAEALEILRSIHRINNRNSKEEFQVKELLEESSPSALGPVSVKDQLVPLFKRPLVKYTAITATLFIFLQTSAFMVWLPTIINQVVTILQTGEGSNLTLCEMINLSNETPPDPNVVPCSINRTALLTLSAFSVLQSSINAFLSIFVNRAGRRNTAMALTLVCGLCGILHNVVPNAIASTILFTIFMQGSLSMGLYVAIIVALFPTHLIALAMALILAAGGLVNFAVIQIVNLMLVNTCEVAFYIIATVFAASAIVLSLLPDDRLLRKQQTPQQTKEIESL